MRTILRISLALVLAGVVTLGAAALYASKSEASEKLAQAPAVSCPSLLLKHWKASSQDEKLAFLFGVVTMLEMEKEWQAGAPLAISSSITPSWVRGLSGQSLGDLREALDSYVAQNPDKMEESVMLALGRLFVVPKLTQAEKAEARLHYRQINAK